MARDGIGVMDAETKVILERMQHDVHEIRRALAGNGDKDGLIIDVDRLKRSRAATNAVLWALFTGIVGVLATLVTQVLAR